MTLTPTVFLRAKFDPDTDIQTTASKIKSLCDKHGVDYDTIEIKDTEQTEAILAFNQITVTDVQEVQGNVLDFEVAITELDGFERFEHRISQSDDYDVNGEELALRLGIEPDEGESLGLSL